MKLSEYLRQLDDDGRKAFAARVSPSASVGYLYQLAGGHRRASAEMAKRIEDATDGQVTRLELRPDLFDGLTPAKAVA
jgi:DNA-binding transcriptional regulator YdaS (Cro superfamily)